MCYLAVLMSCILSQPHAVDGLLFFSAERLPGIDVYTSVYRVDVEKATVNAVYVSQYNVRDVIRAAQSDKVIVHAVAFPSGYTEVDIIDLDGKLLKKIGNAVSAVFLDAVGSRIAYTKGVLDENLRNVSQGTWLYDFESREELQVSDSGLYLEWAPFDGALYIRQGEGGDALRYEVKTNDLVTTDLEYGGFSPDGEYRWGYGMRGGVQIVRRETKEVSSNGFELLDSQRHGGPIQWMNDDLVLVPHYRRELEDYLIYIQTGQTLKVPGRVLSVSDDERFVYICKPGLAIEKLEIAELEVLYPGETGVADAKGKSPEKRSVDDAQKAE